MIYDISLLIVLLMAYGQLQFMPLPCGRREKQILELNSFARIPLGFMPTPIDALPRLSDELGVQILVKRDDYTGFGGGGNKVRKLEYLMAEALAAKAEVLITTGGHQSNHARMVAACAAKFGMKAMLVLRGNKPEHYQGNLLLDRIFGASLEFLDPDDYFHLIDARFEALAQSVTEAGGVPYVIPLGGANATGALGYVRAVREMAEQCKSMNIAPPDTLVLPVGSGGTMAGLLIGCRMFWPQTRVIGVSVSRDAVWFQERIARIANECAALLEVDHTVQPDDVIVADNYVGTSYGVPSADGNAAIERVGRSEGILLDPVYTGKAMAGLFGLVADGTIAPHSRVIFIHCGGSPALFPFADNFVS